MTQWDGHRACHLLPRARIVKRAMPAAMLLAFVLLVFGAPAPFAAKEAPAAPDRHAWRALDTALLPLLVDTVALPRELGVHAGGGGGIAIVGETIVIVDLKGSFFTASAKGDVIKTLALPPLPNHADDYDRFAPKPSKRGDYVVNTGFVVHDLESRAEAGGFRLFVSYERYLTDRKTTALAVSSILIGKTDFLPIGSWQEVYQSQPLAAEWYSGIAGGGRMVVRDDDLYLTVGDYNQDGVFMSGRLEAQEPDSDFGKVVKIDLRTTTKTIVTLGHRNPQGLTVTRDGTIYSTEHGPRGGDALNRIVAGKNYGWPIMTFGTHYTSYDWPNLAAEAKPSAFEKPVFVWVPSIGVSNLMEVANFSPAWDGDLLVGSLKAQSLFRLRRDTDGRVVYSEPIPLGQRLRDIAALPDGTLALWTDEAQLIFLSIDRAKLVANRWPLPW